MIESIKKWWWRLGFKVHQVQVRPVGLKMWSIYHNYNCREFRSFLVHSGYLGLDLSEKITQGLDYSKKEDVIKVAKKFKQMNDKKYEALKERELEFKKRHKVDSIIEIE